MGHDVTAIISAYYAADLIWSKLDGMPDDCETIVVCQQGSDEERLARGFPSCKVITTEDIPTLYRAWNIAIREAGGRYIISSNTDDVLYPYALKVMAGFLDHRQDVAIVHGDCDREINGNIEPWFRTPPSVSPTHCTVGPMPMWRKSLHDRHGWFDETMQVAGDFEFWLRVQTAGETIEHLDVSMGIYRVRDESIEHRMPREHRREIEEIRRRYGTD